MNWLRMITVFENLKNNLNWWGLISGRMFNRIVTMKMIILMQFLFILFQALPILIPAVCFKV